LHFPPGLYYDLLRNRERKDCAVRLEIISVNMSCKCQISPLQRPNPTEASSLPLGFSSSSSSRLYRIPRGHLAAEQNNGHKAECAVYFTCKSAFGAPPPPTQVFSITFLLFTPLFRVKVAIIIDMCPQRSPLMIIYSPSWLVCLL